MKSGRSNSDKHLSRKVAASRPDLRTRKTRLQAFRRWYADKAPFVHFGAKFCGILIVLHLLMLAPFCERIVDGATRLDAEISGAVLNLLGQHNHVTDRTLWWDGKSIVTVLPSCSAFEILCFFASAVIAFPMPFAKKLAGVAAGAAILLTLNLVRIMSLYFIGVHYPGAFNIIHEEIWAMLLVIAPVVLYVAWIKWAARPKLHASNVVA